MESALITGVAGQDGVYLARLLRSRGVRVTGTTRPGRSRNPRVEAYLRDVDIVPVDLADARGLREVVAEVAPDVVFNLAAMSSVARSWERPEESFAVNADAVAVLVAAVLASRSRTGRDVRLVQASTGEVPHGTSPYARSKAAAEEIVRTAREREGLHASTARLHIHESPLRPGTFVSRKVTGAVAEIALGRRHTVNLGNLDVIRDWGFAGEYVDALRLMADHSEPVDLPIGSGVRHTLGDLVSSAFAAVGIADSADRVVHDAALARPADIPELVADPGPARRVLGWSARLGLDDLVRHMVEADLQRLRTGTPEHASYLYPSAP